MIETKPKSRKCPRCGKRAVVGMDYYQGWDTDEGTDWGVVCATCDRRVGHMNLVAAGYTDHQAHETNMETIQQAKKPRTTPKRQGARPW